MYSSSRIIREPVSNNRLDYDKRQNPHIFVPGLIEGTLDDIQLGDEIVIEAEVGGEILLGKGLKHFVFLENSRVPTWITDNHNHAFTFWHCALERGFIQKGSLLIHIDQHTDLATPSKLPQKFLNSSEAEGYANTVLTIADFIVPSLSEGLISEAVMVTGEDRGGAGIFTWQNNELKKLPSLGNFHFEIGSPRSIVVDIDLDYFSQGFDETKTRETVQYWMQKADIITIATSPLFIRQEEALRILKSLQKDLETL